MSIVAAAINVLCLRLLLAQRREDVNLRAAWTFSVNDMLSNLGALAAGVLVMWLGRAWPDLVIGMAIAFVAAKGGLEVLEDARNTAADRRPRTRPEGVRPRCPACWRSHRALTDAPGSLLALSLHRTRVRRACSQGGVLQKARGYKSRNNSTAQSPAWRSGRVGRCYGVQSRPRWFDSNLRLHPSPAFAGATSSDLA